MRPFASVTVAALGGDSGKTLLSLGLAADWAVQGLRVAPFKKGPDYIDAAWLSLAAQAPCRNLDTFLMPDEAIHRTWDYCRQRSDVAVIEGNRGLYDGLDARGSHSTAELAKRLQSPVLLVLDATKKTATLAAIALGMTHYDPELAFAGVVLNKVGGERHQTVARQAIETHTPLKVLGAIPAVSKNDGDLLPGRHLGLVTVDEHPRAREAIERARSLVCDNLDLKQLLELCSQPFPEPPEAVTWPAPGELTQNGGVGPVRIAVLRDSAFSFYYPENLESLRRGGADIVRVDSLRDSELPPDTDALYIGGGFPETHARKISQNVMLLSALRRAAENGLPIYAECGGLMLLCEAMEYEGELHPMAGVFPYRVKWSTKPAGHGYVAAEVLQANPFYRVGQQIRGHEFHHSSVDLRGGLGGVLELSRGTGLGSGSDGLLHKNTLALYTHVHAAGLPQWTEGMLKAARQHRDRR